MACPTGKYFTSVNAACQDCAVPGGDLDALNGRFVPAIGQRLVEEDACTIQCNAGFEKDPNDGTCKPCSAGRTSVSGGRCYDCIAPSHSRYPVGVSLDSAPCLWECMPGFVLRPRSLSPATTCLLG